jgi:asparagine synthase (glutamine-hydrolysing)
VTVALSGDGGDELFAGYQRYARAAAAWQRVSAVPAALRRAGGAAVNALPAASWDAARRLVPAHRLGQLQRVAAGGRDGFGEFYRQSVSYWPQPTRVVLGGHEADDAFAPPALDALGLSPTEQMQWLDTVTYLPGDILAKVDRASMAVSLEARVPLLDHRVVEFTWTLPRRVLVRDGRTKWLLRKVLSRYVPDALVERPKMGFGVPLTAWLRGPLRSWAADLLQVDRLKRDGFLDHRVVCGLWTEHLDERADWSEQLWGILMFQAWRMARVEKGAAA